jgi:hypothetical protein
MGPREDGERGKYLAAAEKKPRRAREPGDGERALEQ